MKTYNLVTQFLIILMLNSFLTAELIVNNFGDNDDFATTSDIYFIREAWEGNFNIAGGDANYIHQESNSAYWIFTESPSTDSVINARTIRMTTNAEFQTKAINDGSAVFLGIRYKDHLPVVYGAMPVYSYNGSAWVEIGKLGGKFDHKWKVEIITLEANSLSAINGRYQFKIGTGQWSQGLTGDLPIDRIELASAEGELTVEADTPGFYPSEGDGNFPNLTKDSCWTVDDKPFFPVGFAAGWTGMNENSWTDMADAGFNTVLFYNWMVINDPYAAGDVWDSLPSAGHYGFSEFLNKSENAGLKTIGIFQNDIKYAVVQNYFNSEEKTLEYITSVCAKHRNHPALLAWSPVDEPDHSAIPEFFSNLEWCMATKEAVRKGDPDHPIYALEMAWRKGAFGHYKDICDFQGYDVYPVFGASVSLIGERADLLVSETGGEKPFIAFLKAYDRTAEQAYMSFAEAYIALIHGAKGIFYWDYGASAPVWDTLSKITNEIKVLNPALLSPSVTVDVNGLNSKCVNSQTDLIQNRYTKGSDGKSYILATALEDEAVDGVQFTVDGLTAGEIITVLFENRTITAGAGTFSDNFPEYGRHVYQFASAVPIEYHMKNKLNADDIRILQSELSGPAFSINSRVKGVLKIYGLTGQLITTLKENHKGNKTEWKWNHKGAKLVGNRMYIARLKTSSIILSKPFVLMNY